MSIDKLDSAFAKSADMWLIQTQQFFTTKLIALKNVSNDLVSEGCVKIASFV